MANGKGWLCVIGLLLAVAAFQAGELPNPLMNAKVGDWVTHEMQGGMQMRQTVVEVTDTHVVVEVKTIMNGEVMNTMKQEIEKKADFSVKDLAMMQGEGEPKISKATLTVNGKEIGCTLVEFEKDGVTTRTWISEEIPVNGLAKAETVGQGPMQGGMIAVDWGRGK